MQNNFKTQQFLDQDQQENLLKQCIENSYKNGTLENHYSKESTQQVILDQVVKQIQFAKKHKNQLQKQLANLETNLIKDRLKKFIQKIQQLSLQNQSLRIQHRNILKEKSIRKNQIHETPRANKIKKTKYNNRSKVENKIKSKIVVDYNSSSKKNLANNNNFLNNSLKFNANMTFQYPQINHQDFNQYQGRGSFPSQYWKKLQNTQRKKTLNDSINKNNNSFSLSEIGFSDLCNQSIKSQIKCQTQIAEQLKNNIFLQFLNSILLQQKIYNNNLIEEINMDVDYQKIPPQIFHKQSNIKLINQLEQKIQQTNTTIKKLETLIQQYQKQIIGINKDINKAKYYTQTTYYDKLKYVQMVKKCQKRNNLKKQLKYKQQKYKILTKDNSDKINIPESLKTLVSLFIDKQLPENYKQYIDHMKKILKSQKISKLDKNNKKTKIKQLIDNIKQGRNKFKQLIGIYNNRINKLQDKINKINKNKL